MKNGAFVVLALYEVHMASAALMVDGCVVAATHEERFTRDKNEMGFPLQAARFCLQTAGVSPSEVDVVAILNDHFDQNGVANLLFKRMSRYSREDWLEENEKFWKPRLVEDREVGRGYFHLMGGWSRVADDHHYDLSGLDLDAPADVLAAAFNTMRREAVQRLLDIPAERVRFMPHYMCHHHHAYYSGPLRGPDVAIIHAEGDGGQYNQAVSRPTPQGLRIVAGTRLFNLGRLYQWMTLMLGMSPYGHEYKVMGLAPYANDKEQARSLRVFERYFKTDADRMVIEFGERPADMFYTFRDQLQAHRFDGIAGALQQVTEDRLAEWLVAVTARTGCRQLAYGGGVAMNVKANMRLAALPEVERLFVPLSPADESNVFGAAYRVTEEHFLASGRDPETIPAMPHAYWGPSYTAADARAALAGTDLSGFEVTENPETDHVAALLADGMVVGRCVGREEFGQRALGNRSILAHPGLPGTVDKINQQIKHRDFWMPFAPTIMAECASDYLDNPKGLAAPFMTIGFATTASGAQAIPQALHPADRTARPQILEQRANPAYHALLSAFRARTGVGALLNTSFNLHGEPIVSSPADALRVFRLTDLDALWIEGHLVRRKAAA
ncbi:MAG: carbamoyltransferase C-terminal domain-containing protein [Magnetospirillum sp.]